MLVDILRYIYIYMHCGWYHWFNAHELGQTPGGGEGQGGLTCCSPQGHRVRHDLATEQQQQSITYPDW